MSTGRCITPTERSILANGPTMPNERIHSRPMDQSMMPTDRPNAASPKKVRRRGQPVDLNHGTNGERSFLCYKRGTTNPITDIQVRHDRGKTTSSLNNTPPLRMVSEATTYFESTVHTNFAIGRKLYTFFNRECGYLVIFIMSMS